MPTNFGFSMAFALALALALTGCSGSFELARSPSIHIGAPPPSARCITLDDRAAFYGGTSKFAAALAGVAAPAALMIKNDDQQLAVAISGGAVGAIAVGAAFVSDASSTSWARECSAR